MVSKRMDVSATAKEAGAVRRGARTARADLRSADLARAVIALQEGGATSVTAIAAGLNAQRIPSARGHGWTAAQVARLLDRL